MMDMYLVCIYVVQFQHIGMLLFLLRIDLTTVSNPVLTQQLRLPATYQDCNRRMLIDNGEDGAEYVRQCV